MTKKEIAEMISLVLTSPTIVLGIGVCVHWGREAFRAMSMPAKLRSSTDWLILGIFVGFLGAVCDNAYWGIAWSSSYIESEAKDALFAKGVYFNIPSRQIAGIYAAYCHLRSFAIHKSELAVSLRFYWILSFLLGVVYVGSLVMTK